MRQYAIQMYTLRNFMKTPEELEDTLSKVAGMGYQSVQIRTPAFTDSETLGKQLKEKGLKADSAYCDVYEIPDSMEQIQREADAFETTVLRTNSIRLEDRNSVEGYRSFAAHLNTCGKLLREKGMDFMYHFHSFEFIQLGDTRGIDILLKETDPDYVMFQPDVFWLTAAGTEPSRSLEMFAGRAKYMHCKDYIIAPTQERAEEVTKRASAPVGTGNLHWDEIFRTAERIGIENFVVEDDMGIQNPFASAGKSIENLKKLGFAK